MTRIVAGTHGGRRLETPVGVGTRPTSDRVREALFSRVESLLGGLDGAAVLDLYAGSGAVGLEALSRGASQAVLVESDRRAAAVVRRNIDGLGLADRAELVARRVEPVARQAARVLAGLVFADPPYAMSAAALREVLADAVAAAWCAPGALIVVERSTRADPWRFPRGIDSVGERRYGETTLWYGQLAGSTPSEQT